MSGRCMACGKPHGGSHGEYHEIRLTPLGMAEGERMNARDDEERRDEQWARMTTATVIAGLLAALVLAGAPIGLSVIGFAFGWAVREVRGER